MLKARCICDWAAHQLQDGICAIQELNFHPNIALCVLLLHPLCLYVTNLSDRQLLDARHSDKSESQASGNAIKQSLQL